MTEGQDMVDVNPFTQERLNEIFKFSPKYEDRVISRESGWLEFKQSFSIAAQSEYTRTCAAFANTKGGYIVFGIANQPHKLLGLNRRPLDAFTKLDPERVSEFFNQHFAPEILWDIHLHEIGDKQFGLLYTHESSEKPVLCTSDAGDKLREGSIYYRYRGRTTRIKYPELRVILEQSRKLEQKLWLRHLAKIARVGVRETGVFDLQTGEITGAQGTFLLDESLLSQLSFIKEGEFSQVKGKPTLKVIGNVETTDGASPIIATKQIIKTKRIGACEIVLAFLDQQKVSDPKEYIKQIGFESTGFLPMYYFMNLDKISVTATISMLKDIVSRSQAKTKLIGRLDQSTTQGMTLPATETHSAKRKRHFVEQLKKKGVQLGPTNRDINYCLQAIRCLTPVEVKHLSPYLRQLLKDLFQENYTSTDGTVADDLRRAICWIDEALYMEKIRNLQTQEPKSVR